MKRSINYFGRILCAFMLCTGLVLTSCEGEEPIGGENTEQNGNENNGSENNGNENEGGNETPEPEPLVTASIQNITYKDVEVIGKLNVSASDLPFCQVVVYYSNEETFNVNTAKSISTTSFDNDNKFTVTLADLDYNTKYNYSVYAKVKSDEIYTELDNFTTSQHPYLILPHDVNVSSAVDLSESGTANSYIVSNAGTYKFKSVKGNSNISVGNVASTDILWETFGTDIAPYACDIIKDVCHNNEYIAFETADIFREGNAVISAKDSEGNILWSWHIWMTDRPEEHCYYNDAGTMMDRNLGATSATPGDVGALGLLYQWGKKDPFLGMVEEYIEVKSTITWPNGHIGPFVDVDTQTIADISVANPMLPISTNQYGGIWSHDEPWQTEKTIYDPCPHGWHVPDIEVWEKALETSSELNAIPFDTVNNGVNFGGVLGDSPTIWYPLNFGRGNFEGYYLSTTDHDYYRGRSCLYLYPSSPAEVEVGEALGYGYKATIRCIKE